MLTESAPRERKPAPTVTSLVELREARQGFLVALVAVLEVVVDMEDLVAKMQDMVVIQEQFMVMVEDLGATQALSMTADVETSLKNTTRAMIWRRLPPRDTRQPHLLPQPEEKWRSLRRKSQKSTFSSLGTMNLLHQRYPHRLVKPQWSGRTTISTTLSPQHQRHRQPQLRRRSPG